VGLYAFEIERIARLPLPKPFRALSLGHPDILATADELFPILGSRLAIDNMQVLVERKFHPKPDIVGNARGVFKAMGGELTVADIRDTYNVDHIVDLNDKFSLRFLRDRFDLVIDPGTSEHCFNVGTALWNMADAVEPMGFIYHMVPLCHWNHGFWNFSPCVFADFYEQNGFKIVALEGEHRCRRRDVVPRQKFKIDHNGMKLNLMCIAQRVKDQEIVFPTQYKYYKLVSDENKG